METSSNNFNKLALIIGNILAWLAVVIVCLLYSTGRLHYHPEYITQLHPNKFTPAGWSFSIWTLILILTGIFVVYQALPSKRDSVLIFQRIGPLFILNYAFMFIWLFCYSYNAIWASLIFMLAAFISMLIIYIRLGVNYTVEGRERVDHEGVPLSQIDFWILQLPFSLSFGWLFLAFVANIAIAFSTIDPNFGWNASGWSVILQIFVMLICLLVLRLRHDPFFACAVAWGFFGIADRYRGDQIVSTSALVAAVVIGIFSIITFVHIIFSFFYRTERYASIHN